MVTIASMRLPHSHKRLNEVEIDLHLQSWEGCTMKDYILLMRNDAPGHHDRDANQWATYLSKLREAGVFQGGSSIGDGICVSKSDSGCLRVISIALRSLVVPILCRHRVLCRANADELGCRWILIVIILPK